MTEPVIRNAQLDDTRYISDLFRTPVTTWQRLDPDGRVQDVTYEALSLYERWLHGGPWMSVETAAIWLNHLLKRGNVVYVAVQAGEIVGYLEAYPGNEPAPFGRHLHVAHLVAPDQDIKDTLMRKLRERATDGDFDRFTTAFSAYDDDARTYYERFGMQRIERTQQYTIAAQTGQGFYKVTEHPNPNPEQINGWRMTIGRQQSARQHWETLWPRLWEVIPEIRERRTHRLSFNAAGQTAFLFCQQQLYAPRTVDVCCWSPKALKTQLITALRDWAHREDYRSLRLSLSDESTRVLPDDTENAPQQQDVYAVDVI